MSFCNREESGSEWGLLEAPEEAGFAVGPQHMWWWSLMGSKAWLMSSSRARSSALVGIWEVLLAASCFMGAVSYASILTLEDSFVLAPKV